MSQIKHWKCSKWQLQNKTLQINKTVKTQIVNSNCTTPDDDQKYGRKHLGRRYWTILLSPGSWLKKNYKTWKITIKNNKTYLNIYIYIYI